MPVIALSFSRLQKLVGKVSKKQILDALPFLVLDIKNKELIVFSKPNNNSYLTQSQLSAGLVKPVAFPELEISVAKTE